MLIFKSLPVMDDRAERPGTGLPRLLKIEHRVGSVAPIHQRYLTRATICRSKMEYCSQKRFEHIHSPSRHLYRAARLYCS